MGNELVQWPCAQYWDKSWNPVIGCQPVSPACEHCYARDIVRRFNMTGVDGIKSFCPTFKDKVKNPPRKGVVFCGNMTDLFGSWVGDAEAGYFVMQTLGYSGKATYLWLTKRVANMCSALEHGTMVPADDPDCVLPFRDCEMSNQYFGFTAENQKWYDDRFRTFRSMKPDWANGWLSVEPLLGVIDLHLEYIAPEDMPFKWIVVGCESGPKRRPCPLEWVENIVFQAQARDIPVFVKQLDFRGKCERDLAKFPASLQIRQVSWHGEEGWNE